MEILLAALILLLLCVVVIRLLGVDPTITFLVAALIFVIYLVSNDSLKGLQ